MHIYQDKNFIYYLILFLCLFFIFILLYRFFKTIDGRGGFGIIELKDPVVEGDDLELICAASIYNYTSNFEWKYENGTFIVQNGKIVLLYFEKRIIFFANFLTAVFGTFR